MRRTAAPTSGAIAWTAPRSTRCCPAYQPQWTVRLGVEELNAAYRRVDLQKDDLEGSRYLRIKHITKLIDAGRLDADLRWSQP